MVGVFIKCYAFPHLSVQFLFIFYLYLFLSVCSISRSFPVINPGHQQWFGANSPLGAAANAQLDRGFPQSHVLFRLAAVSFFLSRFLSCSCFSSPLSLSIICIYLFLNPSTESRCTVMTLIYMYICVHSCRSKCKGPIHTPRAHEIQTL